MNTLATFLLKITLSTILLALWNVNLSATPYSKVYKTSMQPSFIGKVFNDKDGDGYQGINEEGLSGIRIKTVTGLVIITDGNGRYNVPMALGEAQSWGQSLVLRVDNYSLPEGSLVTTENPKIIRFANSGLNTVDFGVQLP